MFIRQTKKKHSKDSKVFFQYSLVQATRLNGKSLQKSILYLGSDELLHDENNRRIVLSVLKQLITNEIDFNLEVPDNLKKLATSYYEKYLIKYAGITEDPIAYQLQASTKEEAQFEQIDLENVHVSDSRSFGPEHLCLQTLDKLKLKPFLLGLGIRMEDTKLALTSIAAKAIYATSEYKTSSILSLNSSLTELLNINEEVSHKQLYRIADLLYSHKEEIDKYLYNHITGLFNLEDSIVIFDISNTYFESRKDGSMLARYGRSKEKRSDCPLVVFTGVINAEGFIRHSRIYEGNKPDSATLSDMITDLEHYSDRNSKKTVVLDAGIATKDNLQLLREKGYKYVCVSRSQVKDYTTEQLKNQVKVSTDRGKNTVGLTLLAKGQDNDTCMMVESSAKRTKEQSMSNKLRLRFEEELKSIRESISQKGGTKKIEKVWMRIGRACQKHRLVNADYKIEVEQKDGIATSMSWRLEQSKVKKDKTNGIYFIRTNIENPQEAGLWEIYNTIRRVESTFRCLKTDLNIRPVYHQKDSRIESHLYLSILAYQLVNTIRHMLAQKDIHHDWKNIVRIMSTQSIQTVEMPGKTKTTNLRKASKPIIQVKEIYDAALCTQTQKTVKKYVVYH